jgi:dTMP kinase
VKPLFISFEGSEGCGKSTQILLLHEWLQQRQQTVTCLREPGGTALGEQIRELLKHHPAGTDMAAESELLLFAASRAELVRKRILPELEKGSWVICDRFLDSTTVYQGIARQLDSASVSTINDFAVGLTLPTLTLVLDLPAREAQIRMQQRRLNQNNQTDRMESEPLAFYEAVTEGYRQLAEQFPERIKLVPASGSRQDVFQSILKEITHAFPCLMD